MANTRIVIESDLTIESLSEESRKAIEASDFPIEGWTIEVFESEINVCPTSGTFAAWNDAIDKQAAELQKAGVRGYITIQDVEFPALDRWTLTDAGVCSQRANIDWE